MPEPPVKPPSQDGPNGSPKPDDAGQPKAPEPTQNNAPRSIVDNPAVKGGFEYKGTTFHDVNPTARNPVYRDPNEKIPTASQQGKTRPYNNNTSDMHAEIGAMYQAYQAGHRGGNAVLRIEGEPVCSNCKADVKKMAAALELEELTVITQEGTVTFKGPKDFLPVNRGGKGWK